MTNSLRQLRHSALGLPSGAYIYSLAACGEDALAVISSDDSLRTFDRRTLQLLPGGAINLIHGGQGDASGATCLCQVTGGGAATPTLATSGRDGSVKVWDIRAGRCDAAASFSTARNIAFEWKDLIPSEWWLRVSADNKVPLTALNFDSSTHSLVAGTELVSSQASVVFWDIRFPSQPRLQYTDSHNDDVTEVQFHPTRNNVLLSGSTDGLVNIYDTSIADEDDALLQVIKHSSIHHAGFLDAKTVYALSHDELFSTHPLTNPDDEDNLSATSSDAPVHFGDLRPALDCEYVVQIPSSPSGHFIAAGNARRRSLELAPIVHAPQGKFHFDRSKAWHLPGAHGDDIVRSVHVDVRSQAVFTCGEDGYVRVWKDGAEEEEGGGEREENKTDKHEQSQAGPVRRHEHATQPRHGKDKKHGKEKQRFKPY